MVLKTMPDGSEFTVAHAAGAAVVGLAIGGVLFAINEKRITWSTKRWMKKTGWPQEAIDRM